MFSGLWRKPYMKWLSASMYKGLQGMNSILKSLARAFRGAADLGRLMAPVKRKSLLFIWVRVKNVPRRFESLEASEMGLMDLLQIWEWKRLFCKGEFSNNLGCARSHTSQGMTQSRWNEEGDGNQTVLATLFHLCSLIGLKGYFSAIVDALVLIFPVSVSLLIVTFAGMFANRQTFARNHSAAL